AALRSQTGSGAFHDAAKLDRIDDIVETEGADHETAAAHALEQALFGKPQQRFTNRSARNIEHLGQRNLEQAHAPRQFPAQYFLPQVRQSPHRMSSAGALFHESRPFSQLTKYTHGSLRSNFNSRSGARKNAALPRNKPRKAS